jgi:hypothetical protein
MRAEEIEVAYAQLAKALNHRSDKEQNLMLSTLGLALMAEHPNLPKVLSLIDSASALTSAPAPREA